MSDTAPNTPSVVERTRIVAAGAPVVGIHFLNRTAAFVLGEESVLLVAGKDEEKRLAVHGGGILSSASDGVWVITGGDDGKVFVTGEKGDSKLVAQDAKHRWIDHVATGPDGALAWSAGKSAYAMAGKGEPKTIEVASTVGGLAFAPKGVRLAVAHYNGVSLWFPNSQAAPETLEWKGSHHHVAFSANGQFLVTAMHSSRCCRPVRRMRIRSEGMGYLFRWRDIGRYSQACRRQSGRQWSRAGVSPTTIRSCVERCSICRYWSSAMWW